MEMILVLLAFIVGGTVVLLSVDWLSDVIARRLVAIAGRLRQRRGRGAER